MDQSKSKLRSSAWEIRPTLSLVYILLLAAFWWCPITSPRPSRQRGIPVPRVKLSPQNRLCRWRFGVRCLRIAHLLNPKAPRLQRARLGTVLSVISEAEADKLTPPLNLVFENNLIGEENRPQADDHQVFCAQPRQNQGFHQLLER